MNINPFELTLVNKETCCQPSRFGISHERWEKVCEKTVGEFIEYCKEKVNNQEQINQDDLLVIASRNVNSLEELALLMKVVLSFEDSIKDKITQLNNLHSNKFKDSENREESDNGGFFQADPD